MSTAPLPRHCAACGAAVPPHGYARLSRDGYCQVCIYEASIAASHAGWREQTREQAYREAQVWAMERIERERAMWFLAGLREGLRLSLRLSAGAIRAAITYELGELATWAQRFGIHTPITKGAVDAPDTPDAPDTTGATPPAAAAAAAAALRTPLGERPLIETPVPALAPVHREQQRRLTRALARASGRPDASYTHARALTGAQQCNRNLWN